MKKKTTSKKPVSTGKLKNKPVRKTAPTQSKNDTAKKLARFLELFVDNGNVSRSARLAKISLRTISRKRREDAIFKQAYDEAYDIGGMIIEGEMFRRAIEGIKKPVFQGGKRIGTVTEYSDSLLGTLARGRMKETYGNNVVVSGDPDNPLTYDDIGRDGAMAEISAIFIAAGLRPPIDTCAGDGSADGAVAGATRPADPSKGK